MKIQSKTAKFEPQTFKSWGRWHTTVPPCLPFKTYVSEFHVWTKTWFFRFKMGTSSTEQYCLRWNDFHANVANAFSDIRDEEDFLDVTLVNLKTESHIFSYLAKKNSLSLLLQIWQLFSLLGTLSPFWSHTSLSLTIWLMIFSFSTFDIRQLSKDLKHLFSGNGLPKLQG